MSPQLKLFVIFILQIILIPLSSSVSLAYLGCYDVDWIDSVMSNSHFAHQRTFLECANDPYCLPENKTYFGLNQGTCFCTEGAPNEEVRLPELRCNLNCEDAEFGCGGTNAFNIYKVSASQSAKGTLDVDMVRALKELPEKLKHLEHAYQGKKDYEDRIESLNANIASTEHDIATMQQEILENSGDCTLLGSKANRTEWLKDIMENPNNLVEKIDDLIKVDKERSLKVARFQLADAKIKDLQMTKEEMENMFEDLETCSLESD